MVESGNTQAYKTSGPEMVLLGPTRAVRHGWAQYAGHKNEAKRLLQKGRYNYEARLTKFSRKQPEKYYTYVQ